jgi:hypothetical protein
MNIYIEKNLMENNHLLGYNRSYIMRSAHKQARDYYDKKIYQTYREALSYSLKNCWLLAYKEKLYSDLEIKFLAVKSNDWGIDTGVHCTYEGKTYYVKSYNIYSGFNNLGILISDINTGALINIIDNNLRKIKWIKK